MSTSTYGVKLGSGNKVAVGRKRRHIRVRRRLRNHRAATAGRDSIRATHDGSGRRRRCWSHTRLGFHDGVRDARAW